MEPSVPVPPVKTPFRKKLWAFVENILYLLGAIGLALLIQTYVIRPFIVSGTSMDPIIKNAQYLLIDQVSYRFGNGPTRGDVVIFKAPPEPSKYYIKRIIGIPGDTVTVNAGKITIRNEAHPDGFILDDSFITHHSNDMTTTTVTDGHYFVMGDNRSGSYDSRAWGLLPKENIQGRALVRLLPLSKIDYLPGKVTFLEQ